MQSDQDKDNNINTSSKNIMSGSAGQSIPLDNLKIWVLAPYLESSDNNINYYYDFTQSIAEYTKIFNELDVEWEWQPVTMNDFSTTIDKIANEGSEKISMILNLCDGDEVNGTPGISVVKKIESKNITYTGSDEYFYRITTSKIPMKKAFDEAKVRTANWKGISSETEDLSNLFKLLGTPIILKPSVSGGSMGVGIRNVVDSHDSLKEQLTNMFNGYRGWNLAIDGIIAEEFITGREFTTMITGSSHLDESCRVYKPVERVFHSSLPEKEKFLSFDRLWEIYEDESPMPGNENFYAYKEVDEVLADAVIKISMEAYRSVRGTGYGRVDIRQDEKTGELYVLEVNAQCGLSEDEDFTSIGAILRVNKTSFKDMIVEIIQDALIRKEKK